MLLTSADHSVCGRRASREFSPPKTLEQKLDYLLDPLTASSRGRTGESDHAGLDRRGSTQPFLARVLSTMRHSISSTRPDIEVRNEGCIELAHLGLIEVTLGPPQGSCKDNANAPNDEQEKYKKLHTRK